MDRHVIDYADARNMMVDGQIRPNRVYGRRLLEALRTLPRERFVPPAMVSRAYSDEDVPLGNGRVLTEPMVLARLIELAGVMPGERALVIGAGTGYAPAVLAACGSQVTALEEDADLLAAARSALAGTGGVTLVQGRLRDGWPAAAPYDLILLDGAADEFPPAWAGQIRVPGGRLVGVLSTTGGIGHAGRAEPSGDSLSFVPAFDCATPVLPALRRVPGFVF